MFLWDGKIHGVRILTGGVCLCIQYTHRKKQWKKRAFSCCWHSELSESEGIHSRPTSGYWFPLVHGKPLKDHLEATRRQVSVISGRSSVAFQCGSVPTHTELNPCEDGLGIGQSSLVTLLSLTLPLLFPPLSFFQSKWEKQQWEVFPEAVGSVDGPSLRRATSSQSKNSATSRRIPFHGSRRGSLVVLLPPPIPIDFPRTWFVVIKQQKCLQIAHMLHIYEISPSDIEGCGICVFHLSGSSMVCVEMCGRSNLQLHQLFKCMQPATCVRKCDHCLACSNLHHNFVLKGIKPLIRTFLSGAPPIFF